MSPHCKTYRPMLDLNVRTLRGAVTLVSLPEETTVQSLKLLLHDTYKSSLQIPAPEQQNIVFGGRLLTHGQLKAIGVCPGSTVVVLQTTPLPKPAPLPAMPAPTAAEIRAAIFEEARRRGIEHKLRDEAPSHVHPALNLPNDLMDMDNQLMGLIEALEGRLGLLRQGGRQGAAGAGVGEAALLAGAGDVPAQQRAAAQAQQAPEPPPDIQPPAPEEEHVLQLCDMGFPDAMVRKALILHRNRVPEAVEWLLQHAEDPDAAEPVTQEQLRRVYGAAQSARGVAAAAPRAGSGAAAAAAVGEGGVAGAAPTAAAGVVASALRELHMSLLQAVGIDTDSAQGLLDRNEGRAASLAQGAAGGPAVVSEAAGQQHQGAQQQQVLVDPLETFRRRLQQQLGGDGGGGSDDDAAAALADLFPLDTLVNMGTAAAHTHEHGQHHDDGDEEGEDEEEGDEEEDEEEEEDDGHDGEGNPPQMDQFRF